MRQLCECGCGREVTKEGNQYIRGHQNRGRTHPEKTKLKMRLSKLGKTPWNKGKTDVYSEETLAKISARMKGKIPWNKGKTHSAESRTKLSVAHLGKTHSPEHVAKVRAALIYSLKDWVEKCPLLLKIEEIREGENGKILGRCTNHNCPNSKENGGWFILTGRQLYERIRSLNNGDDNGNFYCSESCKETCSKFGKSAAALINQDKIAAGYVKEPLHTAEEYSTWREEVFRRQKEELGYNECEYCGNRNVNELSAHHEKPYKTHPEMSLDPDNGIILCNQFSKNKCHYKIGHKAGTDCSTGALANKICI